MTITEDGQIEFNGIILGDNIDTFMEELTGWDDLPPVDSGNSPVPMYHGSYSGYKFARERVITWTGLFNPESSDDWLTKLRAIRAATTISSTEAALTVSTIDEILQVNACVTARSIPNNRLFGAARVANIAIQFTCSDPRRYTVGDVNLDIGFPDPGSSGLTYPLTYPLDYGTAGSTGSSTYINQGDAPMPVIYTVFGPTENPTIMNSSTGNFVSFSIALADGETLAINTANGTVLLNGIADRLYTRTLSSSPLRNMELQPGNNLISITASSWNTSLGSGVRVSGKNAAFF